MLKRIRIENYRSIGEVDIELGPLTLLVGPNGSGKSNFVDAIHFVSDALTYGLDAAVSKRGGIESTRRWAAGRPWDMALKLDLAEGADRRVNYSLAICAETDGHYRVGREALDAVVGDVHDSFVCSGGRVETSGDVPAAAGSGTGTLLAPLWPGAGARFTLDYMRGTGFYSIIPDALRGPQECAPRSLLDADGRNLTAALWDLQQGHPEMMAEVCTAMSYVVPSIVDVRVSRLGGYLLAEFLQGGHWFDSKQMSDGALRALGILVALYQQPPLRLVVIEEPELTMEVRMMSLLRDVIMEAGELRSQVIITTHSPDLVDRFDVGALRVVEMTDDGTRIGPVAPHQIGSVRDRLVLPGDIARIEGFARAQ